MFYCLSIIWILSISGLLTIFFKKKFELVATISILLGALLMYPFGYINKISYGFYLSWIFVLLFFLIIIKWIIKKDKDKLIEFKDNFFTLGLVYFLIILVYFFLRYKLQGFSYCDEFTHWGPMVKETIRLNGFYSQTDSTLIMHKDYPPLFTLVEVLFLGFNKFNYSETIVYIGLETFMFTCLLPIMCNLNIKDKKEWLKGLIITIALILVGVTVDKTSTASDYALVYNSIYVDWALATFGTYGIYMTYKEKDWGIFKFFFLTLICVSFILMKQMGLVYWLIVLIYAFLKVTFVDKKLDRKMLIKGIVLLIIVPILFYISWKYVVNKYEIVRQFDVGELSLKEFFNIINNNTEYEWKYTAFRSFLSATFKRSLVLHPLKMSYVVYVFFITLILCLISIKKKELFYVSGTFFIGAVGYAVAMLLLYCLFFDEYEAPVLASFDRYMGSFLYFASTLTLLLVIDRYQDKLLNVVIILGVLLLFVEYDSLDSLEIRTSIIEDNTHPITVIDQWKGGVHFEREDLNGYRLVFDDLGYLNNTDEEFELFKKALENNEDMYINSADSNIEEFINRVGSIDHLYDGEYYTVTYEDGKYNIVFNPFSFKYYVIRYYAMGI